MVYNKLSTLYTRTLINIGSIFNIIMLMQYKINHINVKYMLKINQGLKTISNNGN